MNTALPVAKINPLNQVLITHVLNEARHGNYNHCRALGFTDAMLVKLQNLTPCALTLLTHAQAVWIKPQVDPVLFDRLMAHIDKEEAHERLVRRALSLGASNPMMAHFFGLNHQQCAQYRRMYEAHMIIGKGRPEGLSEAQKHSIWTRWMDLVKQAEKHTLSKQDQSKPKRAYSDNGSTGQTNKNNPSFGGHLNEMNQLDLMMLIAEEQSLPLVSIWNEINRYLRGDSGRKPQSLQSRKSTKSKGALG